ncbi:phage head protein [Mergibacter septicus]|uniref:Phage head protein n=1 Tax=Mergibacter septicus TaxID=221402 RepID=A0A8E3MGQ8_9PAST|nr:head completion/stabilization protein [Mergibacter septicus]AWX15609.1 phage head protein [Mergibacter septicus]QDJ14863.1 phage head protein [Mergibacter septicus]UTU47709.1 head completion/stabilization protein [Mergibacter septicus]WMR96684.1 head completion/stabilization protein [Mergibacter septicus]
MSSISIPYTPAYKQPQIGKEIERQTASINEKKIIQQTNKAIITNNSFFPDIDLTEVRNSMRIDAMITTERLAQAVIESIISVNQDLSDFDRQNAESLADLKAEKINGISILVHRYKRAVFCLAVADLYERYTAYDSTGDSDKKQEKLNESIADLRRDARYAIRDLLKIRRMTVELI